ncbi:MAG: PorV/PorQ family protein [candidate division WOR-3 bacterium]
MRRYFVIILIPLLLNAFTLFQPGTTGFQFLKLGVGARPVAMGSAYTAVADDANALFWNPAGLGMSESFQGTLMIMNLFQSVTYTSAGITTPLNRFISTGVVGSYLTASDVRRDNLGNEVGTIPISDFLIGPGLAITPIENFSLGGAIKLLGSRLDNYKSYAVSFDAGFIFSPIQYLYIGSSILHLGTPRKFIANWEYQPTNFRVGIAGKLPIYDHSLVVAVDVSAYSDNLPTINIGAEARFKITPLMKTKTRNQWLAVRAGYQSQTSYQLGIYNGFSIGIGYEYEIAPKVGLVLDVVYLSYGFLGDSERISLSLHYSP